MNQGNEWLDAILVRDGVPSRSATESNLESRKRRDLRSSSPQFIAVSSKIYTLIVSSKYTKQIHLLQ